MDKNTLNSRFISCVNSLLDGKIAHSKKEISEKLNISPSLLSEILKSRMNVSAELLALIAYNYNVNPAWLLLGEGDMMRTTQDAASSSNAPSNAPSTQALLEQLKTKDEQIQQLLDIIKSLSAHNK